MYVGEKELKLEVDSVSTSSPYRTRPEADFADFQLIKAIHVERDCEAPATAAHTAEYTTVIVNFAKVF